jgi:hypothetical protein
MEVEQVRVTDDRRVAVEKFDSVDQPLLKSRGPVIST